MSQESFLQKFIVAGEEVTGDELMQHIEKGIVVANRLAETYVHDYEGLLNDALGKHPDNVPDAILRIKTLASGARTAIRQLVQLINHIPDFNNVDPKAIADMLDQLRKMKTIKDPKGGGDKQVNAYRSARTRSENHVSGVQGSLDRQTGNDITDFTHIHQSVTASAFGISMSNRREQKVSDEEPNIDDFLPEKK